MKPRVTNLVVTYTKKYLIVNSLQIVQADAVATALLAPGSALNMLLENKFNQIILAQNEILGHFNRMDARMNLMDARMAACFNEMRARSHNFSIFTYVKKFCSHQGR